MRSDAKAGIPIPRVSVSDYAGGEQQITDTRQTSLRPQNTFLLGYYDIYFDIESGTFEANLNRSASFILNIVPFLNQMTIPKNGITFGSIVVHDDDPTFLGIDVEFSVHHPFPGYAQYQAYDMYGVVIGNGSGSIGYNSLRIPIHGDDLWLKNPDGYTRWFNPTDFTTEKIFGWAPGGWQNLEGSSQLNPYKYFAKNLQKDDNLWSFLTGPNNFDGIFESGVGRTMKLEFPLPEPGLAFGYAVVVAWEDEGPLGPYHPYHHDEAIAASISQIPDAWFDPDTLDFGGNLIFDIDLFAWKVQPSSVKIESDVLDHIASFDFETSASPGGENYSTWHVEVPVDEVHGLEGHEAWIIGEYEAFDYKNGLPEIPSPDDPLAAFFRIDVEILDESPVPDPLVCDVVLDTEISPAMPYEGWARDFAFDASGSYDPNGIGITSYEWDFDNDGGFGDLYDSGDDIHPVKYFDFYNEDKVSLRISNGEIESECYINVDIRAHPSKNLELPQDLDAVDIGIDHTNGDLFVSYLDANTYIYSRADYFQTETHISTIVTLNPIPRYMDVVPNQYHMVGATYTYNDCPGMWLFDPSGGVVNGYGINCSFTYLDVVAMTGGSYMNDVCMVAGYTFIVDGYDYVGIYHWPPDYNPPHWYHSVSISDGNNYGVDRLYYPFVKACESDRDSNCVWFLEDPDYYAQRWLLTNVNLIGYMNYDDAYFGTGYQTSDDDGWYDARDLARDNQNRYFVLDKLENGQPRVKVWTVEGNTTTSIGGFSDSSGIEGEPLRIEGSDFSGEIVVLHGDGIPYMISVFPEWEIPG